MDDEEGGYIKGYNKEILGCEFPKKIKEELERIKEKPLKIYINSYGGSVPAGLAISNMIKRHKAETTAIIDGFCCSIESKYKNCRQR